MDLKEISEKSKKILSNFVDEIGLDGEFYVSGCKCPMVWGRPKFNGCGEFVSPSSERLEKILQNSKYNEKTKKILSERGIILINQKYRQKEPNPDLFITAIHEMIHSNRNLLLFDVIRDKKNENAYTFNNGKFEQNTHEQAFNYADASQEVLKGRIDISKKTIDSYKNTTSEELEDMEFVEGKRDSQMEKQQIVDEALVELMAALSYKLYSNKEKGKAIDIWNAIEQASDAYEGEDIGTMCKIILKHQDLELFNWMIDPISYSQGDIHYDFFGQYTKEDQALLQELYEVAELDLDNNLESLENNKIGIEDMREVAISPIAIEELAKSFQDIRKAQSVKMMDLKENGR